MFCWEANWDCTVCTKDYILHCDSTMGITIANPSLELFKKFFLPENVNNGSILLFIIRLAHFKMVVGKW